MFDYKDKIRLKMLFGQKKKFNCRVFGFEIKNNEFIQKDEELVSFELDTDKETTIYCRPCRYEKTNYTKYDKNFNFRYHEGDRGNTKDIDFNIFIGPKMIGFDDNIGPNCRLKMNLISNAKFIYSKDYDKNADYTNENKRTKTVTTRKISSGGSFTVSDTFKILAILPNNDSAPIIKVYNTNLDKLKDLDYLSNQVLNFEKATDGCIYSSYFEPVTIDNNTSTITTIESKLNDITLVDPEDSAKNYISPKFEKHEDIELYDDKTLKSYINHATNIGVTNNRTEDGFDQFILTFCGIPFYHLSPVDKYNIKTKPYSIFSSMGVYSNILNNPDLSNFENCESAIDDFVDKLKSIKDETFKGLIDQKIQKDNFFKYKNKDIYLVQISYKMEWYIISLSNNEEYSVLKLTNDSANIYNKFNEWTSIVNCKLENTGMVNRAINSNIYYEDYLNGEKLNLTTSVLLSNNKVLNCMDNGTFMTIVNGKKNISSTTIIDENSYIRTIFGIPKYIKTF